ncbi:unnamed protein product [Medioppia subpectinata]|uniref:C2 domain-containing protein n=1 Tax=Medioppia subpectinata TaxID=1979941 RepID=A0A7R9KBD5_9ACAR|nr:unnamed protein product [Medioppia subpectinata]CAG2100293.1 unnamed protein product [Medioppia subpectinata]
MVFLLSETEKLLIIIIASSLFLLSLIITICFVSPVCWLHKWFIESNAKKKEDIKICYSAKQLLTQESKHFQLSVIPHYGANSEIGSKHKSKHINEVSIQVDQNKAKKQSIASEESVSLNTGSIKLEIRYETISNASIRLFINIIEISKLKQRDYLVDPSCYVSIILVGLKNRRRSLINKAIPSALYRTSTAKRCLNPVFNELFVSQDLPKSILKDGLLRIKVFDDERYANDLCLGEATVHLKKVDNTADNLIKEYSLLSSKESKGELLIGLCYLPTSKRVTVSIMKATLSHSTNIQTSNTICYYIRVLLFINGKLMKKKKTATTQKMVWGDNEILTFDLMSFESSESAFMFVLSFKQESSQSPSSPETPVVAEGEESPKDRHIGHFIVGQEMWHQMKQQPRKQITKWHKLY